jgi:hypothetical protein
VTLSCSGGCSVIFVILLLVTSTKSAAHGNNEAPPLPEDLMQMLSVAPVDTPYKHLLAEEEECDIIQVEADKCRTSYYRL